MITWSKNRVDSLGEKLKRGGWTPELLTELEAYRESFADSYDFVVNRLSSLKHSVTGRPAKSTGAIVDKLNRQSSRLSQIQDIAGCRVVVSDVYLQQRAMFAIDAYLDGPHVYDRRKKPSHGYRAVHLVADVAGKKVEIQLRTELQHLWAEVSEKMSDTLGPGLKYGEGDKRALQLLSNLSQLISDIEAEEFERIRFLALPEVREMGLANKRLKKQVRKIEKDFFERKDRLFRVLHTLRDDSIGAIVA